MNAQTSPGAGMKRSAQGVKEAQSRPDESRWEKTASPPASWYRIRLVVVDRRAMADIQRILNIEVPVIVRLGERIMTVKEVLDLVPGSIIELQKRADAELDLLVNNKQIGFGTAAESGRELRVARHLCG